MRKRSGLAAVLAAALLVACGKKDALEFKGELIVALQTDMSIPKDVDKVRIRVASFGNTLFSNDYEVGPSGLKIPATLGLLPNADHPSSPVTIQVIGFRGTKARVFRETITTIPPGRLATMRMPIEWLCDESAKEADGEVLSTCPTEQTCMAGKCVPSAVDSKSLPEYVAADVFGGGSGTGDGSCFDVGRCFADATSVPVDPATCRTTLPTDEEKLNVALKLPGTGDGICSGGVCLIPLDGEEGGHWSRALAPRPGAVDIQLPEGVCDRLKSGKAQSVVVSNRCDTKTTRIPTCGPWSSAGGEGSKVDVVEAGAPDALPDVNAETCPEGLCGSPAACTPPVIDGGFCGGIVTSPAAAAPCRWALPGNIAVGTTGNVFCPNLFNLQVVNKESSSRLPQTLAENCGPFDAWYFDTTVNQAVLCPQTCTNVTASAGKVEFVYGCPAATGPVGPPLDGGFVPPPDGGFASDAGLAPMVAIAPASYFMGCDPTDLACNTDELPAHSVDISRFSIDETEVTQSAYDACVRAGVCSAPPCSWQPQTLPNHPVTCVSWDDASQYCGWVHKRLPSEAEWELAARGGNRFIYPWGNTDPNCSRANFSACSFQTPHAVRTYAAGMSPFGAQDMAGNVEEWVGDWYSPSYYDTNPGPNPMGPPTGVQRITRGGSFKSAAPAIRTSHRQAQDPAMRVDTIGFRCAEPG